MQFVERRIGDRRVLRLLRKWLNAGRGPGRTRGEGRLRAPSSPRCWLTCTCTTCGPVVPSDVAPTSPKRRTILVLRTTSGRTETGGRAVSPRPGGTVEFGLELHPEKTRLVEFGRFAAADRRRRGERKPETFDFLGFRLLCEDPEGTLPAGAEAKRETDEPDPATGGGEAVGSLSGNG